jgi:hypothetical protein
MEHAFVIFDRPFDGIAGVLGRDLSQAAELNSLELSVYPTNRLLNATDRRMALLTLCAGLIITFLLTTLVGILSGARNRAMSQVDEATSALRQDIERREETEARLREREHELQHLAFHDSLTGLANRILYYERVQHALLTHARERHTFAVFFVDLDGFKQVNDSLGHAAGDNVLGEAATRLRNCVRASDTVACVGGRDGVHGEVGVVDHAQRRPVHQLIEHGAQFREPPLVPADRHQMRAVPAGRVGVAGGTALFEAPPGGPFGVGARSELTPAAGRDGV